MRSIKTVIAAMVVALLLSSGVYAGSEENVMWKRENGVLERQGEASVKTGEVFSLPDKAIHSVTNPGELSTAAIHVYGADFSTIK